MADPPLAPRPPHPPSATGGSWPRRPPPRRPCSSPTGFPAPGPPPRGRRLPGLLGAPAATPPAARVDPRRTILGAEQRSWLLRGLDRSHARWNVLAQQVVMTELDIRAGPGRSWWSEAWDGYAADRDRLLRFLWDRQPSNPVVLTGDIHSYMVNDLKVDNRHPRDNPHIRFFDNRRRGYTRCTVIRQRWYTDLRVVDTVKRPGAGVRTLASFVVEDGRPGAERV